MNKDLLQKIYEAKKIILYGASSSGNRLKNNLEFMNVDVENIFFYDSNSAKQGKIFFGRPVLTKDIFFSLEKDTLILISSTVFYEIEKILFAHKFNNFHFSHELIFSRKRYEKFDEPFLSYLKNNEGRSNIDHDELYTIYQSLKATDHLNGDIAEVGVYKGGSAYLLAKYSKGRRLFLFDTFEGLPGKSDGRREGGLIEPSKGWLSDVSVQEVESYILCSGIPSQNLVIKKGLFPKTTVGIEGAKYSLVHLDSDLYDTTKDGLEYFYPRLEVGGRIIFHDYNCCGCPGVRKAVDEFVSAHSLKSLLIEVAESQVILIK
jgi:O-methyltransferase